jgi:thiamine-phosphate pyrophosphorylase
MTDNKVKKSCRLYLITPPQIEVNTFKDDLAAALDSDDVACVQLRLKNASRDETLQAAEILAPVAKERGVSFIMNDSPTLANESGCDGVHIGQGDISYENARNQLGSEAIIGVTCHDMRYLAAEAADKGANYVAFGAFFPTTTKKARSQPKIEIIEIWSTTTTVPCVAIGGITAQNCIPLIQAGADFLAVISAIWDNQTGPANAVKAFNRIIKENI